MWVAETALRVPISTMIANHNVREWNKNHPALPALDPVPEIPRWHMRLVGAQTFLSV